VSPRRWVGLPEIFARGGGDFIFEKLLTNSIEFLREKMLKKTDVMLDVDYGDDHCEPEERGEKKTPLGNSQKKN
jgi:hypothetical protein